jgi:hypothetical protein
MYAVTSLIAALVLFLAFVVWDRRRMQRAPTRALPRDAPAQGWSARPLLVWPVQAGLSLCAASLAVSELLAPSQPPFTGRRSWLYSSLHSQFGTFGIALFWLAICLVLLVLAFLSWHSRKAISGKLPPNAL